MRTWFRTLALVASVSVAAGCGGSESPQPDAGTPKAPPAEPRTPLVPKKAVADWCGEHGVPESACTRCNADLIPGFKAKGDWCEKHALPKSQCTACDPAVADRLKAMAPK